MQAFVDAVAPRGLGQPFRWLLASAWTSNLGDGIALAAGPLLIASQTNSAFLVALAAMLQRLPFLVFGLWAGVLADRLDRRRLVIAANMGRAIVVAALCVTIATGTVSIGIVLATMFLYGVAETFADTTSSTLLPALVPKDHMVVGTHRLQTAFLTCNQLIGPPIGAFLFAAGMVLPFVTQVLAALLAVALVSRIARDPTPDGAPGLALPPRTEQRRIRDDIVSGMRWTWNHPAVRMLALVMVSFNITWAASWSVLVLWSRDVVGMGEVGFGLLSTASAIGGFIGTVLFPWVRRRLKFATIMRVCLSLEVSMHVGLWLTRRGSVALAIMLGFGIYAFMWGTIASYIRQRTVPHELQGRVSSLYTIAIFGGIVVGQVIGGLIAQHFGLRAPFVFAAVGSGLTLALVWRRLSDIAETGAAA